MNKVFYYEGKEAVLDILYFRIDRKRKLPVTTLLYALNYKKKEILELKEMVLMSHTIISNSIKEDK